MSTKATAASDWIWAFSAAGITLGLFALAGAIALRLIYG